MRIDTTILFLPQLHNRKMILYVFFSISILLLQFIVSVYFHRKIISIKDIIHLLCFYFVTPVEYNTILILYHKHEDNDEQQQQQ